MTLKVDLNGILSVMASARGDSSQAGYSGYPQGQVVGSVSNVEMMRRITQEDVRKMTFQSEHLKMDDELQRMLVGSRDELEVLATTIATTLRTPDTLEIYTKNELQSIDTTCQNALTWLEKHPVRNVDSLMRCCKSRTAFAAFCFPNLVAAEVRTIMVALALLY